MSDKSRRLRALIQAPEIVVMPGIYDGYSTRMVQAAGFEMGFVSGGSVSEASLGWADYGIMGMEENLRVCRAIVGCTDLPVMADADTGYGNAVNVHFTVKAFERAGVSGLMIEDQQWPKRCGHLKGKSVISAEEGTEKIAAAAAAREDADFVIMARTDSLATHGLDEAIRRLNMYADAGADLLFADALLTVDQIAAVAKSVSKPLAVNMGFGIRTRSTTPLLSALQLQDLGVAAVLYPRLLAAAALRGMQNAMGVFRESLGQRAPVDRPDLLASFEELNGVTGIEELGRLEARVVARRGAV